MPRILAFARTRHVHRADAFRTFRNLRPCFASASKLRVSFTIPHHPKQGLPSRRIKISARSESLELVDFQDSIIGLDLDSWKFLSSFFNLRRLSMIIQAHFPMNLACQYIPRTVLSLGLSSGGAYSWFCGDLWPSACLLQITQWQPNRLSHRFRR